MREVEAEAGNRGAKLRLNGVVLSVVECLFADIMMLVESVQEI